MLLPQAGAGGCTKDVLSSNPTDRLWYYLRLRLVLVLEHGAGEAGAGGVGEGPSYPGGVEGSGSALGFGLGV